MVNKIQELLHLLIILKRMFGAGDQSQKIGQVTCLQMHVLSYIEEQSRVEMKHIAEYLSITPPSATSLINQLVEMGTLVRMPDKEDRRKVRLALTKKGKRIIEEGKQFLIAQVADVFGGLQARELDQFITLLHKVTSQKN